MAVAVYGMYADVQFFGDFFAEHSFFGKGEYFSLARGEQGIGSTFDSKRYYLTGDFSDTSNGTSGMGIFIVAPCLLGSYCVPSSAMAGVMQVCVRLSRETCVGMG